MGKYKDWLHSVIKDTQDHRRFAIGESRDSETDTEMTALVTYGFGADHGHIELSIDECRTLADFLNKLIKKADK